MGTVNSSQVESFVLKSSEQDIKRLHASLRRQKSEAIEKANSIDGNNLHERGYDGKKQPTHLNSANGLIEWQGTVSGGRRVHIEGDQEKHLSNHSNNSLQRNNRLSGSLLVSSSPLLRASNSLESSSENQRQSTDITLIRAVSSSHQCEHQATSQASATDSTHALFSPCLSPAFPYNRKEREKNPFEIDSSSLDSVDINKDLRQGPVDKLTRLDSLFERNSLKSADLQPWTLNASMSDLCSPCTPSPAPASPGLHCFLLAGSPFPSATVSQDPATSHLITMRHEHHLPGRMHHQVSEEEEATDDARRRNARDLFEPTLVELDQLLSIEEQSSLNDRLNLSVNEEGSASRSNGSLINVTETGSSSFAARSRVHPQSISSSPPSSSMLRSTYNLIKRKRGVSNTDERSVNSQKPLDVHQSAPGRLPSYDEAEQLLIDSIEFEYTAGNNSTMRYPRSGNKL